jgi:hypothetical protein
MKPNIFMGNYQQPENKLTYNFLALVSYFNNKGFLEWLTGFQLSETPVSDIDTVLGGESGNPDGRIELITNDKIKVSVYIESKTYRRGIDTDQLIRHLDRLDKKDKLLVITPRISDKNIVYEMNNEKIIFKTWNEISDKLSKYNDMVTEQFVKYGEESGEFEGLGEISNQEILDYIKIKESYNHLGSILEEASSKFEHKIDLIFNSLLYEDDFKEILGLKFINTIYYNAWGRMGIEINYKTPGKKYGQWWAISYYYDTDDHEIEFKNALPEIAFFFDINPEHLNKLQKDKEFREILRKLCLQGFESNIDGQLSSNKWRLLVFRKPISEFSYINISEIKSFIKSVIEILNASNAFEHKYFNEFT